MGVGGGDASDALAFGSELGEGVVAGRVERVAVVPQLDEDPDPSERFGQAVELATGSGRTIGRRGDEFEVEGYGTADLGSQLDGARIAGEAALLLPAGAQVGAGRPRQPRVELGEAAPGADGGEGGGQTALRRGGVVGVGRGDASDVAFGSELGEGVVAGRVERVAVVPQLDEDPIAPERFDQAVELATGSGRTIGSKCRGNGALATTGEHPGVTATTPATSSSVNCGALFSPARWPRLIALANLA